MTVNEIRNKKIDLLLTPYFEATLNGLANNTPWPRGHWLTENIPFAIKAGLKLLFDTVNKDAIDDRLLQVTDLRGYTSDEQMQHISFSDTRLKHWYGKEEVELINTTFRPITPSDEVELITRFRWLKDKDPRDAIYQKFCRFIDSLSNVRYIHQGIFFCGFSSYLIDKGFDSISYLMEHPTTHELTELVAEFYHPKLSYYVKITLYVKVLNDLLHTLVVEEKNRK